MLFGECSRGPPVTANELVDQVVDTPMADSELPSKSTSSRHIKTRTTYQLRKYKVDPTNLGHMAQKTSGVSYRLSKCLSDKVKGEKGVAKFGDVIEGIDEYDGWLKVGRYYLPILHRGVPVVIPFVDEEEEEEVIEKSPTLPQRKPWNMRPSVGTWHAVQFRPVVTTPVDGSATATASSTEEEEQEVAAPREAQPWSRRPSVGTWLRTPQVLRVVAPVAEQVQGSESQLPEVEEPAVHDEAEVQGAESQLQVEEPAAQDETEVQAAEVQLQVEEPAVQDESEEEDPWLLHARLQKVEQERAARPSQEVDASKLKGVDFIQEADITFAANAGGA